MKVFKKMEELLVAWHIGPATRRHNLNGTTTFTWYTSDDDDRIVEATNSTLRDLVFLVSRDEDEVCARILRDPTAAAMFVREELESMAKKHPRKGRARR